METCPLGAGGGDKFPPPPLNLTPFYTDWLLRYTTSMAADRRHQQDTNSGGGANSVAAALPLTSGQTLRTNEAECSKGLHPTVTYHRHLHRLLF
jgi:hypothetical protein